MTRRQTRCAVPLWVLFAVLLAGHILRATPVAHAQATKTAQPAQAAQPDRMARSDLVAKRERVAEPSRLAPQDPSDPGADRETAQETAQTASSAKLRADGSLSDVAGLSEKDIWAVGQQDVWDFWQNQGVITHWNGTAWTEVDVRNDTTGAGHLRSIAAASVDELWAVGDGHDGLPYVAKGGTDGFDRVGVPQLRAGDWLGGVTAAFGRVVTVGSREGKTFMAATAGGSWTTTRGPAGALYGAALSGRADGWAVGDSGSRPLIMRLTATGWKAVRLPEIRGGFLRDVHVEGTKRAIAVGGVYEGGDKIRPLVLLWDGKHWTRAELGDRFAELYGVTGDGDGGFWVSGYDARRPGEAFVLRYDGSGWRDLRGQESAEERTVRLQAVTHVGKLTMGVGHALDASDRYHDLVETFGPTETR